VILNASKMNVFTNLRQFLILLPDPQPVITSVPFDLPADLKGSSETDIGKWYASQNSETSLSRVRLYKLLFARQNRLPQEENQLQEPPGYLALVSISLDFIFWSAYC
jgi:hypothetical protein